MEVNCNSYIFYSLPNVYIDLITAQLLFSWKQIDRKWRIADCLHSTFKWVAMVISYSEPSRSVSRS